MDPMDIWYRRYSSRSQGLHSVTLEGCKAKSMPFAMVPGTRIIFFEHQHTGTADIWLTGTVPMRMGPAAVIGQEGQNYWLARTGRCILPALNYVLTAEYEEVSGRGQ